MTQYWYILRFYVRTLIVCIVIDIFQVFVAIRFCTLQTALTEWSDLKDWCMVDLYN